jgi:hypothetical protein
MLTQEKLDTRFAIYSEEFYDNNKVKYIVHIDIKGTMTIENTSEINLVMSSESISVLNTIVENGREFFRSTYPGLKGFVPTATEHNRTFLNLLFNIISFCEKWESPLLNRKELTSLNLANKVNNEEYPMFVATHDEFNIYFTFKIDIYGGCIMGHMHIDKDPHLNHFDWCIDSLDTAAGDKLFCLYKNEIDKHTKIINAMQNKLNRIRTKPF